MYTYIKLNADNVVIQRNQSSSEYSKETIDSANFIVYTSDEFPVGHTYINGELGPIPDPEPLEPEQQDSSETATVTP